MLLVLLSAAIAACFGVACLAGTAFLVWKKATKESKWVYIYVGGGAFLLFVLGLGAAILFGHSA